MAKKSISVNREMTGPTELFALANHTDVSEDMREVYRMVGDSMSSKRSLDMSEINAIKDSMYTESLGDKVGMSLDEAKELAMKKTTEVIDGFYNPVNGLGTPADPGWYNTAFTPISMTPNEVTAYYSSGGIPRRITDLKANGVVINGYFFESKHPVWKKDSLDKLFDYAEQHNFRAFIVESTRDGMLYGGSVLVPHLKGDNPYTYQYTIEELMKNRILKEDSLEYFWTADRWNAVLIPDYNISAESYLHPSEMFIPIASKTVRTNKHNGRAAIIRPKRLPYWGTLRQVGWGVSDMEGWIFSVLAYEMCMRQIPIMAQQGSLLYRHIPLDGLVAQNGPEAANRLAAEMSLQMVQMSNIAPKTFNSVGEIKTIERSYQGFNDLVNILKQDIGAQSSIPDSVIFNTQPTGFSDNKEDVTLKQAETIKQVSNEIKTQLQNVIKVMVISCFGPNSLEAQYADQVQLCFDSPIVATNEERTQAATTLGTLVTSITGAGGSLRDSLIIAQKFMPGIEIPADVMERLNESEEFHDPEQPIDGQEPFINKITKPQGNFLGKITKPGESFLSKITKPKESFVNKITKPKESNESWLKSIFQKSAGKK